MSEQTSDSDSGTDSATEEMVEIYVDTAVCVGMGMCEVIEPTVFEIDDDAISQVIGSASFPAERAKQVMFECPSGALKAK